MKLLTLSLLAASALSATTIAQNPVFSSWDLAKISNFACTGSANCGNLTVALTLLNSNVGNNETAIQWTDANGTVLASGPTSLTLSYDVISNGSFMPPVFYGRLTTDFMGELVTNFSECLTPIGGGACQPLDTTLKALTVNETITLAPITDGTQPVAGVLSNIFPTPEPATVMLLGFGLAVMGSIRKLRADR